MNYLTLPWLLLVLFVPAGLQAVLSWPKQSIILAVLAVCAAGLLLHERKDLRPTVEQHDLETQPLANLRLLSDWPYLEASSMEPEMLDPYFYHQLALQGLWSSKPIDTAVSEKSYDLVLLGGKDAEEQESFYVHSYRGYSDWNIETLASLREYYRPLCEVPGYIALVPKARASRVQTSDVSGVFKTPCQTTQRSVQQTPGTH